MLVGDIPTPLKNISQWRLFFPIWKNKKCSKPPTRMCIVYIYAIYIYIYPIGMCICVYMHRFYAAYIYTKYMRVGLSRYGVDRPS